MRRLLSAALAGLLAALIGSQAAAAEPQEAVAERKATIYFSSAPWDGAAYALEIPLDKSKEAPEPFIRVNLWGNLAFSYSRSFHFSGNEDPGGGADKGVGRASFQAALNKSWPEKLAGTIVVNDLRPGHPVSGTYALETLSGKKFKGSFKAGWGNEAPRVIR
jgi:hypothetical protein